MKEDDDADDDENAIGATRYPCMPSLVALQQMRNRLHLALLGKKLMKWTAQATIRELRRIALDLQSEYEGGKLYKEYESFKDEIRQAFILLARARFFYPSMNNIVLENISETASFHIKTTTRSVSGVRIYVLGIIEDDGDPYSCLGLGLGGQTITEAKKIWRELVRKMVHLAELRRSFNDIDVANKNATKRMTTMKRIVIPRIKATMVYINFGLEEQSREDTYRLKMVMDKKRQKRAKLAAEKDKLEEEDYYDNKPDDQPSSAIEPLPPPAPPVQINIAELPSIPVQLSKKVIPYKTISWNDQKDIKYPEPKPICGDKCSKMKTDMISLTSICPGMEDLDQESVRLSAVCVCDEGNVNPCMSPQGSDNLISVIKERLIDIIAQSKVFLEKGIKNIDAGLFLKACESVRSHIENLFQTDETSRDNNFRMKLDKLKTNLHEVIDLTKNEIEKCAQTSKLMNDDLDVNKIDLSELTEHPAKLKLESIKHEIDDVVKVASNIKKDGLLAHSVDKFLNTCSSVRSKIDQYTRTTSDDYSFDKLEYLSKHVPSLKSDNMQVDDSDSFEVIRNFLESLKEFEMQLDEYKLRQNLTPADDGIKKLISQLDGAIVLTKEAKKGGYLTDSVEKFISQCEIMKLKLSKTPPKKVDSSEFADLDINDVMPKLLRYLTGGSLTPSTENVVKFLERKAIKETGLSAEDSACSLTCICNNDLSSSDNNLSPTSSKTHEAKASSCEYCKDTKTDTKESKDTKGVETDLEDNSSLYDTYDDAGGSVPLDTTSLKSNDRSKYTKIKKITKITRVQGSDGIVSEETETITIRKEQVNSDDTSLNEDNELSDDAIKKDDKELSDDAITEDDKGLSGNAIIKDDKEVGICMTPDFPQRGFMRRARSDFCLNITPLCHTGFWPSTSFEHFKYLKD